VGLLKPIITFYGLCSALQAWAADLSETGVETSLIAMADSSSSDSLRVVAAEPFTWVPIVFAFLLSGVVFLVFRLRR
jgi:hypothetical protein